MEAATELKLALGVFWMVFLAELGDRTQVATLLMAADQPTHRLSVFAGAAAGDAEYTVRAIQQVERMEPQTWLVLPAFVRCASLFRNVARSAPVQAWMGERGRSLVWPKEAPPLPDDVRAQFTDFRVESGRPPADGLP